MLEAINLTFSVGVLVQYSMELVAFGFPRNRKKEFLFETIGCLYILCFFLYKARLGILNSGDTLNRALNGVAIFFQILRYLKCNCWLR